MNMMALYFTSVAMGTVLSGWLAQFYSMETEVLLLHLDGYYHHRDRCAAVPGAQAGSEDDARREVATKLLIYTANSLLRAA